MNNSADLATVPVRTLFFKYYIPVLTSLLSVTAHQVINGIILGQYVGSEGVAAVGLFGPVLTIFIAFTLALMIGGGILISRSNGAGNYAYSQQVFQFSTTVAIMIGIIIAFAGIVLTKPVTTLLAGKEGAIAESTYDYFFWSFLWLPFFLLRMIWGNCITNDSGPKVSRNASLFSVVLNILLDVLLIIIIPMGTAGASIATGLAVFGGLVYLFIYIKKEKGHLSFTNFKFTLRLPEWKELVNYGMPSFVSELSFSAGLILINSALLPFGATAIAVFGLINYISFIFLRLFTAAMISILPIISFNIGAGQHQRVLEVLRFSLLFTLALGGIVFASSTLFSGPLISAFAGRDSETFLTSATHAIALYFILFLAAGPNYILSAYLQSIGKSGMSITINLLKGIVLVWIFLMLLTETFDMGLNGIWLSRGLTEITTLVIIVILTIYYRKSYYAPEVILAKSKKYPV
jgi:putative MATE family efflux protein